MLVNIFSFHFNAVVTIYSSRVAYVGMTQTTLSMFVLMKTCLTH